MTQSRTRFTIGSAGSALAAIGFLVLAGCADDTGLEKRYPVSGTVTYKDQPLEKGEISFIPADANSKTQRPATGTIVNGKYTLSTATSGDGAFPGKYKVSVRSQEIDKSQVEATIKKFGGGGRQDQIAKATAKAKNLIPEKYLSSEMSGLEADVKATSNTFDFPLKD